MDESDSKTPSPLAKGVDNMLEPTADPDDPDNEIEDIDFKFFRNCLGGVRKNLIQKSLVLHHIPTGILVKSYDEVMYIRPNTLDFLVKLSVCFILI